MRPHRLGTCLNNDYWLLHNYVWILNISHKNTHRRKWIDFADLHENLRRHAIKMQLIPFGTEAFREKRKAFKREVRI